MNRRAFVTGLGAVLAAPRAAEAQQAAAKVARVGFILFNVPVSEMVGREPKSDLAKAFLHGLRDLGWVEGENIEIERRSADGRSDRLPLVIREVVERNVHVVVVASTGAAQLARCNESRGCSPRPTWGN